MVPTPMNHRATAIRNGDIRDGKVIATVDAAVKVIEDGASIAIGGFGIPGAPVQLMAAVVRSGRREIEVIANNGGLFEWQLGPMLDQGRVRRVVASHIGFNRRLDEAYRLGRIEVELVPQGTLVERLRAAGAGLAAFFSPTGADTLVETGGIPWRYGPSGEVLVASPPRETRVFEGRTFLLETALQPDVALIRASVGDRLGNLVFHGSTRNFNPVWAQAARFTIAEVEHLVEPGMIDPADIHLPGTWVDTVVEVGAEDKRFEIPPPDDLDPLDHDDVRHRIARRVAREIAPGTCVNLGAGIPTLVANYVPDGAVILSENGVLGVGRPATRGTADVDVIDASKRPSSLTTGGAFMDSATTFAMIRGGRLDLSVLGAMQVSASGDLANWTAPGRSTAGMGGAMDLVVGARRVIAATLHNDGERSKIVDECSYPLTGRKVVDRIITDLAVIDVTEDGLVLREIAPDVTVAQVISRTAAPLMVPRPPDLMEATGS